MAGFGVVERERGFGVAERIRGTADSTLEGEIGEIGSVSCAASLLDLYGVEVNDVWAANIGRAGVGGPCSYRGGTGKEIGMGAIKTKRG
jgi:hypothetical protein